MKRHAAIALLCTSLITLSTLTQRENSENPLASPYIVDTTYVIAKIPKDQTLLLQYVS